MAFLLRRALPRPPIIARPAPAAVDCVVMRALLVVLLVACSSRQDAPPTRTGPCPAGTLEALDSDPCGVEGLECTCDGSGRVVSARMPSSARNPLLEDAWDTREYTYEDDRLVRVRYGGPLGAS